MTVAVIPRPMTGTRRIMQMVPSARRAVSVTLSSGHATATASPGRAPAQGCRDRGAGWGRGGCYHGSQPANGRSVIHLAGEPERRARPDAGYAMAVLLRHPIMGCRTSSCRLQQSSSEKEPSYLSVPPVCGAVRCTSAIRQRLPAQRRRPLGRIPGKNQDPVTNGDFRSCRRSNCRPARPTSPAFSNVPA